MEDKTRQLIDGLVADARPVERFRMSRGLVRTAAAFASTLLVVLLVLGARQGLLNREFSAFFIVANGLLLVLGLACASAVVAMASPRVGAEHDGPRWAMIMAGVLPLAGMAALVDHGLTGPFDREGPMCMALGLLSSFLVGGVLLAWLRQGAPVSPERTGLFLGAAAGALGTFAYGMACPFDSIEHLGIWHAAPVIVAAFIGRFLIARWLRW